jgi:phosphatidylglycerol:prolipoprotein diacylglycerol transferase
LYPILLKIGPLTIHTYGAMYALGILAAAGLSEYLYRRKGGEPGVIVDMALPVMIGVILGARTLFVIVEREYYLQNPLEVTMIWNGGLVFYGGLIGGTIAFIILCRVKKLPLLALADIVAPGVALGHALGRLGCFFAGSCYGKPTDVPWAVVYKDPHSMAAGILGIPVHPTQLYSAAFLVVLSGILIFIGTRTAFQGQVAAAYGILYGTFRFFMEFLRGDPRGTISLGVITLSTSQAVSLMLVPLSIGIYVYLKKKGARNDRGKVLLQDRVGHSLRAGGG